MSQPTRKSDSFVEGWQKTIRFLSDATDGSPVDELLKDHLRARDNETTQAETIAELEAELARLRPSGQMAEHQKLLLALAEDSLPNDVMPEFRSALSSLAAKAKGYEAIRAALAKNYGADGDPLERVRLLIKQRDDAENEQAVEEDCRHRVELERDREAARAEKAEQDRAAAVADNAALTKDRDAWRALAERLHVDAPPAAFVANAEQARRWEDAKEALQVLRGTSLCRDHAHPGTALLERMRALENVVVTLAIGWGGTLSGMAALRAQAQALVAGTAPGNGGASPEVESVLTARVAALREHAQMLYECAPPTNGRTSREHNEQWEKAKRIHHEVLGAQDVGADLLTELNDHRRNVEALRDELGAKDDEHVVDALHRWQERHHQTQQFMVSEVEAILTTLPRVVRVREGGGPENLRATLAVSVAALQRDFRNALDKAAAAGADAAAAWDEANGGITAATARRGVAIANAIRALTKTGPTS